MPTSNQLALCLRRREQGESDLIVTLLTREAGKLAAVARGVRKPKSRQAPVCQLFALSRVQLATRGDHGGLPVLAQAQLEETFYDLRADLDRSARAAYLVELADLAIPDHEPQPTLFDLLLASLAALTTALEPRVVMHSFELQLLAELGLEPVLDRCAHCALPLGDEAALFDAPAGGLIHARHGGSAQATSVSPEAVRAMRRLLRPDAYELDLTTLRMPPMLARPVAAALRSAVRCFLDAEPRALAIIEQLADEPEP
ncbi:MAG: DNA repair protein RecO [Armatimonadetes bacterium]|nr:DNA repair protein RecO [Armatimonadota bacterium]